MAAGIAVEWKRIRIRVIKVWSRRRRRRFVGKYLQEGALHDPEKSRHRWEIRTDDDGHDLDGYPKRIFDSLLHQC